MNATDGKDDPAPVDAVPVISVLPTMHSPTVSLHALLRRGFQHEQMKKRQKATGSQYFSNKEFSMNVDALLATYRIRKYEEKCSLIIFH